MATRRTSIPGPDGPGMEGRKRDTGCDRLEPTGGQRLFPRQDARPDGPFTIVFRHS